MSITGCGGGGGGSPHQPPAGPPSYYVDCSASTNGSGTQASPWNSLATVNAVSFLPGDQLLLKRGTSCQGALKPLGSGSSGSPIVIDAYGAGAQPVIDGGMNDAVITLSDQQYWEIRNLEIVGGNKFGIFVWGNTPSSSLNHIHLINLNLHGAHFISTTTRDSGEVYMSPAGMNQVLNDVLIDGVSAHDSQASQGILVQAGGDYNGELAACQQQPTPAAKIGSNITIRNSSVHDVYGDGIVLQAAENGRLQNNVVYNTGFCPTCGVTTSGLWEWCCHDCTIEGNESYANHPSGGPYDGGDFAIDLYNVNNVLQYNYGHDSDGYCILVGPGSGPPAATNSVVRYNICTNNGRSSTIPPQGEILVLNNVSGVEIYNNTIHANAAINSAALIAHTPSSSSVGIIENNIIYSTGPQLIQVDSSYTRDYNFYWSTSSSMPAWEVNGVIYHSLIAYQAGSGQEAHSFYEDPLLNDPTYHSPGRPTSAFTLQTGSPARAAGTNVCAGITGCSMGTRDFFGNPLPNATGYDVGANQAQ
jgi:parallel beta-helix repeat protein